jgi:hypothetical protein
MPTGRQISGDPGRLIAGILPHQPPAHGELEHGLAQGHQVGGVGEEVGHALGDALPGGFDFLMGVGVAQGGEGGVAQGGAGGFAGVAGGFQAVEQGHQGVDAGDDAVLFGEGGHGDE